MNITFINATAAISGGSLTVLKELVPFCKDPGTLYVFFLNPFVAKQKIFNKKNFKVFTYDTSNWFLRIFWDLSYCDTISRSFLNQFTPVKYNFISLQNSPVRSKLFQFVYYHQAIPFSNFKFHVSSGFTDFVKFYLIKFFYFKFCRTLMKEGDSFIVQSEWLKDIFSKISVDNEVFVLRPNLDTSLINKALIDSSISSHQLSKNKKIIFFPSAFYPYKNHFFLLKVISLLADCCSDFIFVVTFDRGQHDGFDRLVDELQVADYVYYSGYLNYSEVLHFYKQCHCVVFPSEIESFGLPLIESAVLGSAVVSLKLPYATDILKNYDGAFLLESLSVDDWFVTIFQILNADKKNFNYDLIVSTNWNSILNRYYNVY